MSLQKLKQRAFENPEVKAEYERLEVEFRFIDELLSMRSKAERLREEGMQQGMHEGVEATLRKLIDLKFGPLPEWADQQVAAASDVQLDEWISGILTSGSLDELLGKSQ